MLALVAPMDDVAEPVSVNAEPAPSIVTVPVPLPVEPIVKLVPLMESVPPADTFVVLPPLSESALAVEKVEPAP